MYIRQTTLIQTLFIWRLLSKRKHNQRLYFTQQILVAQMEENT